MQIIQQINKKAIISDLDNTIFPVNSIGDELFASLFELIIRDGKHNQSIKKIRKDIMRQPFQKVANNYNFSEELKQKGIALLKDLTYNGKIEPFEDYQFLRNLPVDKFLVTTGFFKLQQSKVEGLKLENDFKEIHIIDPTISDQTKKDVFADIINGDGYMIQEVLVLGDDIESEIKAAQELGIDAVLYDKLRIYGGILNVRRIDDFRELNRFL